MRIDVAAMMGRLLGRKPAEAPVGFTQAPGEPDPELTAKYNFVKAVESVERRLEMWSALPVLPPTGQRCAIILTHWLQTAVPFVFLEIGCHLRSQGIDVTLVWDPADLGFNTNPHTSTEVARLEKLLPALEKLFTVVRVDEVEPAENPVSRRDLELWFHENAVWITKKEADAPGFTREHSAYLELADARLRKIGRIVGQLEGAWWLAPGGAFGIGGLYVMTLERTGGDFTTLDSGPHLLAIGCRTVAGFHTDVAITAIEIMKRADRRLIDEAVEVSSRLVVDKRAGRDLYRLQPEGRTSSNEWDCDLLVCLNRRPDTAAMLRQKVFPGVLDWIRELHEWNWRGPKVKICVRQHPCERWSKFAKQDDYLGFCRALDPHEKFLKLIPAAAEVNTYDLAERARAVLPYTSRLAMEATILGRPVVLCSEAYYGDLGFVWAAGSKSEYFAYLERALRGELSVSKEMIESASVAYFVFSKMEWLQTQFTPIPGDFVVWIDQSPEMLWNSPGLDELSEALIERKSLSSVRLARRLR
jgi:hypothetical protein